MSKTVVENHLVEKELRLSGCDVHGILRSHPAASAEFTKKNSQMSFWCLEQTYSLINGGEFNGDDLPW